MNLRNSNVQIVLVVLENLLATGVILSGVILAAARLVTGSKFYPEGYPGGGGSVLALCLFVPNVLLQYICVRTAVRIISRGLTNKRRFILFLWQRTLLYGLSLVLFVFCYDVVTLTTRSPMTGAWSLVVIWSGWLVYFVLSPLLIGWTTLLRRARVICPLCPRCRYWLRGATTNRCPECGLRLTATVIQRT